jgi:uncharacterized protein (TIGR03066 family)
MTRFGIGLITCCAVMLVGCKSTSTTVTGNSNVEKIVGHWEMIESKETARHKPPTETIEFTEDGAFVMQMNGAIEIVGKYRIDNDSIILSHPDGQTQMGDPMRIKRLTADSLVLTGVAGKETEFVRKPSSSQK